METALRLFKLLAFRSSIQPHYYDVAVTSVCEEPSVNSRTQHFEFFYLMNSNASKPSSLSFGIDAIDCYLIFTRLICDYQR